MKESELMLQECKKLQEELNECYKQAGYKARYLGWCNKENLRLTKCKMKHFELKRKEHNEESLRHRKRE